MISLFIVILFFLCILWFDCTVRKDSKAFTAHIHFLFILGFITPLFIDLPPTNGEGNFLVLLLLIPIYWIFTTVKMAVLSVQQKSWLPFVFGFLQTSIVIWFPAILASGLTRH